MSQSFAEVVEEVKQLSPAEMEQLQELLKNYLIEKRRRQIQENGRAGFKDLKGKLESFSNIDELVISLSHD